MMKIIRGFLEKLQHTGIPGSCICAVTIEMLKITYLKIKYLFFCNAPLSAINLRVARHAFATSQT